MYQQHNNQTNQNMFNQPQYYSNNYPVKQQQNYNPNTQYNNLSHNQGSKFTAQQYWNQPHFRQQNDCQTAVLSLHNVSQDTGAAKISSGLYQQNQQHVERHQQNQQHVERQNQHQQRITPSPSYPVPVNPFPAQHLGENNFDNQYSASSQTLYPSTSFRHHPSAVDHQQHQQQQQHQEERFPSWRDTKPATQTSVSNSISPGHVDYNVPFNQFTTPQSLLVDSGSSGLMASWHRPASTQTVLPPHQSVQPPHPSVQPPHPSVQPPHQGVQPRLDSRSSTSSSTMPVLENMNEIENPPDLSNIVSYLKGPPPLITIPDISNNVEDQISSRKISPQEERRHEAPLRDLKKMYRLQKQSENSEVFRKPKEKHKQSPGPNILKSVSPKHRIASPDSTLLPDISQPKTFVVSCEPSVTSDDNCEPPLSPISDSDATVCYGKDDDDESLKRRCKDFDSPVREFKSGALKRSFNDGDVEYENIEKRVKMISPRRECDSTNEFVEDRLTNNCLDRLTPLSPTPVVGCVIYNDVFYVRYFLRDTHKFYLLNDIRPFLKRNKALLKSIKPIQTCISCTESEEKLLNYRYPCTGSHLTTIVTSNLKFVAFENDPEIHCRLISVREVTDNVKNVIENLDKQISAEEMSNASDMITDNRDRTNKQILVNNTGTTSETQPSALTSLTLKNELDKLSGMAQEVIHSAFSSLLEECRSLQEKNQKLTEKIQFKDEKIQSYEVTLKRVSSLL